MTANIKYGSGVPGDNELKLCGDLGDGERALELGISDWFNSIEFALAGTKSIAVDPDIDKIDTTRAKASAADIRVQYHQTALADLGDVASGSCDVVVAAQTLGDVDDLGRLLRQVHRVLVPSRPLVISVPHPFTSITPEHPYGASERSIGDWFTALGRANFRVDRLLELGVGQTSPAPTTLVLRARKEGS